MTNTPATELVTPERAKEIKRAAARHAAGMLLVSLGEWAPQQYAPHDARDDAEEELLRDEIEHIAAELRAQARAGTRGHCAVCNRGYSIKGDGTIRRHFGITLAGFSTGNPCPGADKPPRPASA
ncbi:hypothetical protein [Streptomyces albogriseolus]|uniref:hypothetical protein n=1 Tax=Streptomyces albogriseolus TaxID=1887 RepID=UPI003CEB3F4C